MTVVAVMNSEGKIVLETMVPTAASPIRELIESLSGPLRVRQSHMCPHFLPLFSSTWVTYFKESTRGSPVRSASWSGTPPEGLPILRTENPGS